MKIVLDTILDTILATIEVLAIFFIRASRQSSLFKYFYSREAVSEKYPEKAMQMDIADRANITGRAVSHPEQ